MWHFLEENFSLFSVSGRHVARYLQARLTNDVANLPQGASLPAAALSPQGRVEGLFQVFRRSPENFLLWSQTGASAESLMQNLLRFKVSESLESEECSEQWSSFICSEQSLGIRESVLTATLSGGHILVLIPKSPEWALATTLDWGPILDRAHYHAQRVMSGRALYPSEINSEHLLLELPMAEDYISRHKGCYAGQEAVEKLSALGRAPFRILPYASLQVLEQGELLIHNEGNKEVGKILSGFQLNEPIALPSGIACHALGFLRIKNVDLGELRTASGSHLYLL
jgi:folate-binding protein YgfZ